MDEQHRRDLDMTPVQALMVSAHEMVECAEAAGFSHEDALYLAANVICGGPKIPPGRDE